MVQAPGVYLEEIFPEADPVLMTGVPVFLGLATDGPVNQPQLITLWPQFVEQFGTSDSYLAYAVRGFFENGGLLCYVVRLGQDGTGATQVSDDDLAAGLLAIDSLSTIDLVCVPDLMVGSPASADAILRWQNQVLLHCDAAGDRFAILDGFGVSLLPQPRSVDTTASGPILDQCTSLQGQAGALYFPWIKVQHLSEPITIWVPPCGHIAGVYSRGDRQIGVHKAPANAVLNQVLDLQLNLTPDQQAPLNDGNVNCLRAFPGRGIRIWGARTVSQDPNWRYINVRRLFITISRWLALNMADVVFEANNIRLWVRIEREITSYLRSLLHHGALRGPTEATSFFVHCNADTNPPEVRQAGQLVTEIGVAAAVPNEFITVRLILGDSGVTMEE